MNAYQALRILRGLLGGLILATGMPAAAQYDVARTPPDEGEFHWPDGKRVAVSLSFDDARPSQLDHGVPLFNRYGVNATFYVNPLRAAERGADWRRAAEDGHEIGNHSLTHPCSGNFDFIDNTRALENKTLDMMAQEMDEAGDLIARMVGIRPATWAYPCGMTFVGRGRDVRSYIPLVAERFLVGRGWMGENSNDPRFVDLAQVIAMKIDQLTFEEAKALIGQAAERGKWLVLAGHDIRPDGTGLTTLTATLDELCRYVQDPTNHIWVDTIEHIAAYIRNQRAQSTGQ